VNRLALLKLSYIDDKRDEADHKVEEAYAWLKIEGSKGLSRFEGHTHW